MLKSAVDGSVGQMAASHRSVFCNVYVLARWGGVSNEGTLPPGKPSAFIKPTSFTLSLLLLSLSFSLSVSIACSQCQQQTTVA